MAALSYSESLAERITEQINRTIISKSSGLSPNDCVEALETIEAFCQGWAQTIRAEHTDV